MSYEIDLFNAAERALSRVDNLKTLLVGAAAASAETPQSHAYSREMRAACVVYSMAELEALTTTVLHIANAEINSGSHSIKECRPSLRALAGHSTFESLRDTIDSNKVWQHRQLVTNFEECDEVAILPVSDKSQPPLDGKTLTPRHFDRIWSIYGLAGQWFPNVRCAMTLTKLRGLRNDLAHGNIPFADVFSQPGMTSIEIEAYIADICELFIHLPYAFSDHLTKRSYLI